MRISIRTFLILRVKASFFQKTNVTLLIFGEYNPKNRDKKNPYKNIILLFKVTILIIYNRTVKILHHLLQELD